MLILAFCIVGLFAAIPLGVITVQCIRDKEFREFGKTVGFLILAVAILLPLIWSISVLSEHYA